MCYVTGSNVKVEGELKDEDRRNQTITDSFLSTFVEVVEPHSSLLATYIILTKILQQFQEEREYNMLTYGNLFEWLNKLITDPIMAQKSKGTSLQIKYVISFQIIIGHFLL